MDAAAPHSGRFSAALVIGATAVSAAVVFAALVMAGRFTPPGRQTPLGVQVRLPLCASAAADLRLPSSLLTVHGRGAYCTW